MTRTISDLIEHVKSGIGWYDWYSYHCIPEHLIHIARNGYHGSLDSARSFHKELLPCDWHWWKTSSGAIVVGPRNDENWISVKDQVSYQDDCDAKAWVIAILMAHERMSQNETE